METDLFSKLVLLNYLDIKINLLLIQKLIFQYFEFF